VGRGLEGNVAGTMRQARGAPTLDKDLPKHTGLGPAAAVCARVAGRWKRRKKWALCAREARALGVQKRAGLGVGTHTQMMHTTRK
jgi:hypothetical protein